MIIFVWTLCTHILLLRLANARRRRLRAKRLEMISNMLSSSLSVIPEDVETWTEWPSRTRIPSIGADSNDSRSSPESSEKVLQPAMEIWDEWAGRSCIASSDGTNSDDENRSRGSNSVHTTSSGDVDIIEEDLEASRCREHEEEIQKPSCLRVCR